MKDAQIRFAEKLPIVDLRAQYQTIRDEIFSAIENVLESQHFILGPNVAALEREIADLCASPYAVGVASGTDALILALRAAGVGPGDEVIVPAFSFVATADAVSILGAIPVFADIEPVTFNINVAHAATLVTGRTRAIIPVHLYGQPADMDAIRALSIRHGLVVVEDCAQALGARWKNKPTCSLGDYGCISFFPSKNLGAYGDGGMVTSQSANSAAELRRLRSHGSSRKYHSDVLGMNSRLDEIQASILRVKRPHLQEWNEGRRRVAGLYRQALAEMPWVQLPCESPDAYHVYHQFTIRVAARDDVQQALRQSGVETMVYYPVPLHLQPMYAHFNYKPGDLPVAERAAKEVLSIPIFPEMTESEVARVVDCLAECNSAAV